MPLKTLGWRAVILAAALFVILTLPSFQRRCSGWLSPGEYNVSTEKVTIGWPWTWFESVVYTEQEGTLPPRAWLPEGREWTPGTRLLWWRFLLLFPLYFTGGIVLAMFYTYVLFPSARGCQRSPSWRLLLCSMYGIAFFTGVWTLDAASGWSREFSDILRTAGIFTGIGLLSLGTALTVYRCASYPLSATACVLLYGSLIWSAMVYPIFVEAAPRFSWNWEEMGQASALFLPIFLIPSLILTMVRRTRLKKKLALLKTSLSTLRGERGG
jgi:hypothetical protein